MDAGAVALAIGGPLLGWVAHMLVGRGVYGRLDKFEARLGVLEKRHGDIETRLKIGNMSFDHLRKQVNRAEGQVAKLISLSRTKGSSDAG